MIIKMYEFNEHQTKMIITIFWAVLSFRGYREFNYAIALRVCVCYV